MTALVSVHNQDIVVGGVNADPAEAVTFSRRFLCSGSTREVSLEGAHCCDRALNFIFFKYVHNFEICFI